MNKLADRRDDAEEEQQSEAKGPNLFLLYALLALALLAAMAVAAMIIWPFYLRR